MPEKCVGDMLHGRECTAQATHNDTWCDRCYLASRLSRIGDYNLTVEILSMYDRIGKLEARNAVL